MLGQLIETEHPSKKKVFYLPLYGPKTNQSIQQQKLQH